VHSWATSAHFTRPAKRPETVRAHVASHDREIAGRDVGKKPVLVAERDDAASVRLSPPAGDLEVPMLER
jgi:hypothetical protein